MERAYQRRYPRPAERRTSTASRGKRSNMARTNMGTKYKKKLGIQTAVCVVIFAVLWGINATDTDIAAAVRSAVTDAMAADTDYEYIYKSTMQMSKGLAAMMVRETPQYSDTPPDAEMPVDSDISAEVSEQEGEIEAVETIAPQDGAASQDGVIQQESDIPQNSDAETEGAW